MYISGTVSAVILVFLVAFGVIPFVTVASLTDSSICVSFCFFVYHLVYFTKNYFQKTRVKVPNPNGQYIPNGFEDSRAKNTENEPIYSENKKNDLN